MMDDTGHWSGVDARELLARPDVVVAIIPRREQIRDLEGRFTYVGTCHWKGDFYVVLTVPDPHDRLLLNLRFTTIPPDNIPRINLPEITYGKDRT